MRRIFLTVLPVAGLALLVACSPAPTPTGINDPLEDRNRAVHAFNKAVDRNLLRPIARTRKPGPPGFVGRAVGNFGSNLSTPRYVVNDLLQGRIEDALHNTMRFAFNTVFGLGGVWDIAGDAGIEDRPTDFGATLHAWGFLEGAYLELPFVGPSTERDLLGRVGDTLLDPLRLVIKPPESFVATGARIAAGAQARGQLSDTIDSILYDSADSYAQLRLLYLERRRFELGGDGAGAEADGSEIDPYDTGIDPYAE